MAPYWIWVALGAVALLIVVGIFVGASRSRRSSHLRERFGSEYDHAVSSTRSRSRAESELAAREAREGSLRIRPLRAEERSRFSSDWERIEREFVDRPTTAVAQADELIGEILSVRGYPVGSFEKRASDLSVKEPELVEHYRDAHRAIEAHAQGQVTTEDLRQSMIHYRELFDRLVSRPADVERPVAGLSEREIDRERARERRIEDEREERLR